MQGRKRAVRLGGVVVLAGFLMAAFGCVSGGGSVSPPAPTAVPAQVPEKKAETPEASLPPLQAPYYPAPNCMDLCGEPVPLNIREVYERFDKEFTLIVYNHAQVYLWLKRMQRWFPMIEERLRYYNLPDDLKWVAIVESDLIPNAVSPKGAAGPWQFMPGTGSAYGLDQRGSVDRRYDFERATDSAFLYLNDLDQKFNSWSLAIAAYNCGVKRIMDESRTQGVRDYYLLKLPQETERYVMRILAVKAVLTNPRQYGYDLPKEWGYQELKLDKVCVTCPVPVSVQGAAAAAGITYRAFKNLNPVFRSDTIPAGTHEIKLPAGRGTDFEQNLRSVTSQASYNPVERDDAPQASERHVSSPASTSHSHHQARPARVNTYTVQRGDTLSGISRKFSVDVKALKKANKLRSDVLSPGQKLAIP